MQRTFHLLPWSETLAAAHGAFSRNVQHAAAAPLARGGSPVPRKMRARRAWRERTQHSAGRPRLVRSAASSSGSGQLAPRAHRTLGSLLLWSHDWRPDLPCARRPSSSRAPVLCAYTFVLTVSRRPPQPLRNRVHFAVVHRASPLAQKWRTTGAAISVRGVTTIRVGTSVRRRGIIRRAPTRETVRVAILTLLDANCAISHLMS